MLPLEEDEVLLAIAEELVKFKFYLNSTQLLSLIPVYQYLLCVEETVVREQTVEDMRDYTSCFSDDVIQSHIVPMVLIFNLV
jgi:hypothetical protein